LEGKKVKKLKLYTIGEISANKDNERRRRRRRS